MVNTYMGELGVLFEGADWSSGGGLVWYDCLFTSKMTEMQYGLPITHSNMPSCM